MAINCIKPDNEKYLLLSKAKKSAEKGTDIMYINTDASNTVKAGFATK